MFSFNSIEQYQKQLYEGKTSCSEATAYYLEKINANKKLNAFVEVYALESIERAKFLDQKRGNGQVCGKLHGVIYCNKRCYML